MDFTKYLIGYITGNGALVFPKQDSYLHRTELDSSFKLHKALYDLGKIKAIVIWRGLIPIPKNLEEISKLERNSLDLWFKEYDLDYVEFKNLKGDSIKFTQEEYLDYSK